MDPCYFPELRGPSLFNLLRTLEVPVNDLVVMEVLHARGDLLGPIDQPHGRDLVWALPQEVEEGTVRAKLHDNAVAWRLGANTAELKYNFDLLDYIGIICVFK
jgi:hypothetical protein